MLRGSRQVSGLVRKISCVVNVVSWSTLLFFVYVIDVGTEATRRTVSHHSMEKSLFVQENVRLPPTETASTSSGVLLARIFWWLILVGHHLFNLPHTACAMTIRGLISGLRNIDRLEEAWRAWKLAADIQPGMPARIPHKLHFAEQFLATGEDRRTFPCVFATSQRGGLPTINKVTPIGRHSHQT